MATRDRGWTFSFHLVAIVETYSARRTERWSVGSEGRGHLLCLRTPWVEAVLGPQAPAGSGGGSLEDLFHFVVVILIETTNLLRFFRTLQLSVHVAILRTVAGLNAQPTIGPELPFAPEPVRRLHQREQAGGSDRTDAGNLT